MIEGEFFRLDRDSRQDEGQVLFRYLHVKIRDKGAHKDKDCAPYPVYLALKPHAIDFYYHGPVLGEKSSKNIPCGADLSDGKINHEHIRILHLPLSMNLAVKDNLTARLSHAFYDYKEVPHIYDLKESGSKFYSNLSLWNECSKSDANDKENNLSFRRLILDFLYDLEHSRVFYASGIFE